MAKVSGIFVSLFGFALFFLGLFIILMVLVQRGKGGGLAGALGGAGGQSAFGARATDQITWITASTVAVWILLSAASVMFLNPNRNLEQTAPVEGVVAPEGEVTPSPGEE